MPRRNLHYYLIKIARLSGWLLFFLVLLYILTGFSLCGEYGFNKVVDYRTAFVIHQWFEWPLIVVFLVHSSVTMYFAFRRWGWIKKRKGA